VANYANLKFDRIAPEIIKVQKEMEKNFLSIQPHYESQMTSMIERGISNTPTNARQTILRQRVATPINTQQALIRRNITDQSVMWGNEVFSRWQDLAADVFTKFNDGYIRADDGSYPREGDPYPDNWLRSVVAERPEQFKIPNASKVIFEEPFAKELRPGWSWIREVPDGWRIKDGGLEIKMENLSMAKEGWRNLLYRKAPKQEEGPFTVSVEVKALQPYTNQYQQAGLYWMQNGQLRFKFVLEIIDGTVLVHPSNKPLEAEHVVLRLRIDGRRVIAEYQPNAVGEFLPAFEAQLPERNDDTDQISLQCWHGPENTEAWIRFKQFVIEKSE